MIIIGLKDCLLCKSYRKRFADLKYIEMPDIHIGLGDTISAITNFFKIRPCKSCMIRRHWLNKWFPYKRAKSKIDPFLIELKQKIILSNIQEYPVFMDDECQKFIIRPSLEDFE